MQLGNLRVGLGTGNLVQRVDYAKVTYGCMLDACVKCGHLEKAPGIYGGFSGLLECGIVGFFFVVPSICNLLFGSMKMFVSLSSFGLSC